MTGVSFYGDIDVKGYVKASNGKLLGVVSSMPTAVQKLSGCAVLFTGTSDAYVTGAVYECVSSGTGYAWNRVDAVTAVDDALSTTSANPVQNKVVTAALDGKASTATATTGAAGLMSAADKTKLDGITGGLESLTDEQMAVLDNESLQSGYFIDGGSFTTSKMELLMHPASGGTVAITAKPGNNITFSVNSSDDISINATVPDISGKADSSDLVSFQETVASTYAKAADLADVATSGKYSDLDGTPTIPTVGNGTITIQRNGSSVGTFTTNQSTAGTINITVPTATSGITNDSGFITNAVSDLTNYYTKSNTYTKSEIDALVAAKLTLTTVTALPTTSISTSTIYLLKNTSNSVSQNVYDEYIYTGSAWEKIGTTETDLSGYAKTSSLATVATSGSYSDLSNKPTLSTSTSGSGNVVTGISVSDHAITLTKGITALTAHPGITMGTDTTSTASPAHGGTFTAIDSITKDSNGHVTKVNTKTITLPSDNNTDTMVTQAYSTANAEYPLLMTATSGVTSTSTRGATTAIVNNGIHANPSTGKLTATGFVGPLTGDVTGNASTATSATTATTAGSFTSAKSVALTGDVTGSASSTGGWSVAATLASSGVTAGSYGPSANASPSHSGTFSVPYITVDAKGRVTAAATKTITLPSDNNTDTMVTQTNSTAATAYPILLKNGTGTTTSTTTALFNSGVTVTPSTGTITATTFSGALSGNATSATKATQDASGNVITSTYAKKPVVVTSVSCSSWASDSTYSDFPYKGTVTVSGCTTSHVPSVTFSLDDAVSGNYAPVADSGAGVVYIWSKTNTTITIPAVVCILKQ